LSLFFPFGWWFFLKDQFYIYVFFVRLFELWNVDFDSSDCEIMKGILSKFRSHNNHHANLRPIELFVESLSAIWLQVFIMNGRRSELDLEW
jgi:hypothetical protein